ncbi:hypothetical protein C0Q70_21721 [Pomacea canaliculata]|uniref:Uncharacterized protein n=1 Tax=Pomacea canaliculata TaxID=400727 RepID=A0A2T7NDB4_POMCA|nr:hypothetical protein C0Q70_21721 [Pomacea canaliculata]
MCAARRGGEERRRSTAPARICYMCICILYTVSLMQGAQTYFYSRWRHYRVISLSEPEDRSLAHSVTDRKNANWRRGQRAGERGEEAAHKDKVTVYHLHKGVR